MKILVIQLLRLGDIFSIMPVLTSLRKKHPGCEIDLLINEQFKKVQPLLPEWVKLKTLPRNAILQELVDNHSPLTKPYKVLQNTLHQLNANSYDLVLNLTQNRFSAYLAGLIEADEVRGMHVVDRNVFKFGNEWFEYLNSEHSDAPSRFHQTDIFKYGSGLDYSLPEYGLVETEFGQKEADRFHSGDQPLLLIQPLTSDEKKNWGLDKHTEMIKSLEVFFSNHKILILGAPSEESQLRDWKKSFINSAELAICGLEAVYSLLKRADLLITPDTSIKHLASAAKTKTMELSIGSSNFRALGAYSPGSLIVQSKEFCAPCSHSRSCYRSSHYCAERVPPREMAQIAAHYTVDDWDTIQRIAKRNKDKISIHRTEFSQSGLWQAEEIVSSPEKYISRRVEQLSWKVDLHFRENRQSFAGSESLVLADLLAKDEGLQEHWKGYLEKMNLLENQLDELEEVKKECFSKINDKRAISKFIDSVNTFSNRIPSHFYYYKNSMNVGLDSGNDFISVKKAWAKIKEARERLSREKKMINMANDRILGIR